MQGANCLLGRLAAPNLPALMLLALPRLRSCSRTSQLTAETLGMVCLSFLSLFMMSLAVGVGVGLASAYLIRRSFAKQHSTDRWVGWVGGWRVMTER